MSLLHPEAQRRESRHTNPRSVADLETLLRANWTSWRAYLRVTAVVLCVASIGCIAWAYAVGPHGKIDHHISDGQDVPWVLIPVSSTRCSRL